MGSSNHHYKKFLWILLMLSVLGATGFYAWYVIKNTARVTEPAPLPGERTSQEIVEPITVPTAEPVVAAEKPLFDPAVLQSTLDTWNTEMPGTKGVVIMSTDGKVLASTNPDRLFFAASIYKLYTAYFGYREVDAGRVSSAEQYSNGRTRSECLDVMIRESDSPCGERMMAEIGKTELTTSLKEVGITNTSMSNLSTTAQDAALMMARIARGEGLTPASQTTFLQSAKEQIFRDALNKGFTANVTVYNKIGFRELVEYHDVALVELKDGRKFVVAVLTENTGTKNIAELGRRLEAIVQ